MQFPRNGKYATGTATMELLAFCLFFSGLGWIRSRSLLCKLREPDPRVVVENARREMPLAQPLALQRLDHGAS